jgi:glycolate oxidase FAD binding subunit
MTSIEHGAAPTTLRPENLHEARDAVLDTPGSLGITGAGTAADWAGRLRDVDAVLDLSRLRGVIAHNPGDMTVSVHAGTPLRDLQAELAEHGQHVSLDAARIADGATVGGLVATADAGPSALVHGGMRDLVIGTTTLLADGTVARSGGHVIKNVAGYDLAKLMHGSYGTLGALVEVVLRLHPTPKATGTVALACPLAEAAGHAVRVLESPLEPTALEWISGERSTSEQGRLLVRIESTEAALPARMERVAALLGAGAETTSDDVWDVHVSLVRGSGDGAVLRIGARPSRLPGLLAGLPCTTVTAGLGTGVATVTVPGTAVAEAHEAVHAVGGTSVLRRRPAGLDAPAWGPPPSALAVLNAVKAQFDPDGRFGPGRFDPWEIP